MYDHKEILLLLAEKIDKVADKQDKVYDELIEIKVTQGKQAGILEEHIRRTELAEKAIERLNEVDEMIYDEMEPLNNHVKYVQGAMKATVFLGVIIGVITGLGKLFHFL